MLNLRFYSDYLKHYMELHGDTKASLSKLLDLTPAYLSRLMSPKEKIYLSDKKLEQLAKRYKMTDAEYFEIIFQYLLENYSENRGRRILMKVKRYLKYFEKVFEEKNAKEITSIKEYKSDPIQNILHEIADIQNKDARDVLLSSVGYVKDRYLKEENKG